MSKEVDMFKVNGITVANIQNTSGIVFFGITVLAGSNYETPNIAGISHFAEHMYFKGSSTRNWKQINEEFAKLGVSNNAYTSNTEVMYHATCPKDNTEKVIALLMDMFFNSTFPADEMEKERGVITEEKKMYEDDHRSAFSNAIGANMMEWDMGHDTIGTFDTIKSITRDEVMGYLRSQTNLDNFVLVCVGDIKSEDLTRYIESNVPDKHDYLRPGNGLHKVANGKLWNKKTMECPDKIKFIFERENTTQSMVYMLTDCLPTDHPLIHAEAVLLGAIGGGMFSKLFSRIREELGLCYSVGMYAQPASYPDVRIATLYGMVSPENVDKFIEESEKVLQDVIKNGLDENIFECAKTSHLAQVLRQTETSAGKAMFVSKKVLFKKPCSVEESANKIRAVTREQCGEVAKMILQGRYNWAVMNPKAKA